MPGPFSPPFLAPWPHLAPIPSATPQEAMQQMMSPVNEDVVDLLSNSEAEEFPDLIRPSSRRI